MMLAKNGLRGALVAMAAGLLASGCGSGHGSAAAKPSIPSSSSIAAATTTNPVVPPTSEATSSSTSTTSGTYLATLLVAPASLGAGFVVDTKADMVSGEDNGVTTIADITQVDCSKTLHSDWMVNAGMGDALAFRMYKNGDTREVTEEFDHFDNPTTAQSYMKNIDRLATVCAGRVTDPGTGSKVTFSGKAVGALGDEAYAITGTSPGWDSGQTMEAVRVGDVVVTTFAVNGVAKDNGANLAAKIMTDAAAKLKSAT
jgi:hypothetical protein